MLRLAEGYWRRHPCPYRRCHPCFGRFSSRYHCSCQGGTGSSEGTGGDTDGEAGSAGGQDNVRKSLNRVVGEGLRVL